MKSPGEKDTIQIEITNACILNCPNCTRHCGHFKRPFFMDHATFIKAIDSLENYPGRVGIMGGEPTLHPDFGGLVALYAEKIDKGVKFKNNRKPLRCGYEYNLPKNWLAKSRRGLWTSLGEKYYEHFELIQDIFDFQAINDHQIPGKHQALMVTRKELQIPDKKWFEMRDKCWVQNCWSASITPKGAFFCEIAAAFDMLFDGPGGWPIEPGWWTRTPEDFGSQLDWCEMCGAALNTPLQNTDLVEDIVSPVMLDKLIVVGSPKINRGEYVVYDLNLGRFEMTEEQASRSGAWHLEDGNRMHRISSKNLSIKPHVVSLYCSGFECLQSIDRSELQILEKNELVKMNFVDWVIICLKGKIVTDIDFDVFTKNVFNPGCLYYKLRNVSTAVLDGYQTDACEIWDNSDLLFFNRKASALRGLTVLPLTEDLVSLFDMEKVVHLDNYPELLTDNV